MLIVENYGLLLSCLPLCDGSLSSFLEYRMFQAPLNETLRFERRVVDASASLALWKKISCVVAFGIQIELYPTLVAQGYFVNKSVCLFRALRKDNLIERV